MTRRKQRARILLPVIFVSSALIAGCGPKTPVYIPQEYYRTPPPQAQRPAAPPSGVPLAPQQPGPVLTKPPEFKKQDIPQSQPSPPPPGQPAAPPTAQPPAKKHEEAVSPQLTASMQLVNQARSPLDRGKPDMAIPVLEKAVQIDPENPAAYMLLARAWRQKGAKPKALEFAKKAELLYQDDSAKLREVFLLEADLYRDLGDNAKSAQYRKKAAGLK